MEAARKTDESRMAASEAATATSVQEMEHLLTAESPSPLTSPKSIAFAPVYEPVPVLAASIPSRPKVDEMLICSSDGEVLYDWQCLNPTLWVGFIEFISQRAPRLSQSLPIGAFNRIEIESGGARVVLAVTEQQGIMVKTRRESLQQVIR